MKESTPALAVWVFVINTEDPEEKELVSAAQLKWLEQWNPPEEWMQ